MTRTATKSLQARFDKRGIFLDLSDAEILRKAQMTLRTWSEALCNGEIYREVASGFSYRVIQYGMGQTAKFRVPDREAGAIRRVRDVCTRLGLHFYHQTDPRGCALYVSREALSETDYSNGIACSV